jgi:hypothetical protein
VARAEAGARVAVEVLVEEDEVAERRIVLEDRPFAEDWAPAVRAADEQALEAPRQVLGPPEGNIPPRSRADTRR